MHRKNLYLFIVISLITVFYITGCSSKKRITVADVGDDKITLYEFEKEFLRSIGNNLDSAKKTTLKDRMVFLDLLIKYKLKVLDGREKGLLESPELKNEVSDFKKQYMINYVIDKEIVEPKIKQLYERKKYEIRASHIFIPLQRTALPQDSVNAYQKIDVILKRLNSGEDFSLVASEMSEDPSSKLNGGDLYWITGGMTIPEFEDAIYNTKPGKYTEIPLRSNFGLHIVKVTDKKKRVESVRGSHILIQEQRDSLNNIIDSIGTLDKAKDILNRLKNGENFEALANQFSNDPATSGRGGDLGFFERRRFVPSFDSVAFTLNVGEISDLIRTPMGWEILKITEIKEYQPYETQKDNLKNLFKRSELFRESQREYLKKAREFYGLQIDKGAVVIFAAKIDTAKIIGGQNLDSIFSEMEKNITLANISGQNITIKNIIDYLKIPNEISNMMATNQNLQLLVESTADNIIYTLIAEDKNFEKDDEFKEEMEVFENGFLVSKVELSEIMSKVKITENEMLNYYNTNKETYKYTEKDSVKYRTFDEVRAMISNILQDERKKSVENQYISALKQKYPVKIYEDKLQEAFME